MPKSEIQNPPADALDGENRMILAKDGNASGITVGYSCEAYGVFGVVINGELVPSIQPCVVARKRLPPFSECGDSGSWLWDNLKRPAGMITSGAG